MMALLGITSNLVQWPLASLQQNTPLQPKYTFPGRPPLERQEMSVKLLTEYLQQQAVIITIMDIVFIQLAT